MPTRPRRTSGDSIRLRIFDCNSASVCTGTGVGDGVGTGIGVARGDGLTIGFGVGVGNSDTAPVLADTNLPKGNAAKAAHPTSTRQANRTGNFISLILSEKSQAGNRNLLRVPPTAGVLIHQLDITGDPRYRMPTCDEEIVCRNTTGRECVPEAQACASKGVKLNTNYKRPRTLKVLGLFCEIFRGAKKTLTDGACRAYVRGIAQVFIVNN